jgi:hypothetical protein
VLVKWVRLVCVGEVGQVVGVVLVKWVRLVCVGEVGQVDSCW